MRLFISLILIITFHSLLLFYGKSVKISKKDNNNAIRLNLVSINHYKRTNHKPTKQLNNGQNQINQTQIKSQPQIIQNNHHAIKDNYLAKLNKFIGESINFPERARKLKISGEQLVVFTIHKNGKISDIKLQESIHDILDSNTLETIENLPNFDKFPDSINTKELKVSIPISYQIN